MINATVLLTDRKLVAGKNTMINYMVFFQSQYIPLVVIAHFFIKQLASIILYRKSSLYGNASMNITLPSYPYKIHRLRYYAWLLDSCKYNCSGRSNFFYGALIKENLFTVKAVFSTCLRPPKTEPGLVKKFERKILLPRCFQRRHCCPHDSGEQSRQLEPYLQPA